MCCLYVLRMLSHRHASLSDFVIVDRLLAHENKIMNMRAHLLYEACIARFPSLGKETGAQYVNESLAVCHFVLLFVLTSCDLPQNFPQRVQVGGFSKALATLLKSVDANDSLAFSTQEQLLDKLTDLMKFGKEPPKPLAMLLMHSLQWVGMDSLNQSLDMLETLFRVASPPQRQSLSLMMSAVLSNNFDATIKDHCIDWYLRLARTLNITPTSKRSRM